MLRGTIPAELTTLSSMTIFNVYANDLMGTIPPLRGLVSLERFNVESNKLTGTAFPDGLVELVSLVSYRVSTNFLIGTLATDLGQLTKLDELWAASNMIEGTIPAQMLALPALSSLVLYMNSITGHIPSEIGLCTSLVTLILSQNKLTGTIPGEMLRLTSLLEILMNENFLTGSISEDFGNLFRLESLGLAKNSLNGILPRGLGKLTALGKFFCFCFLSFQTQTHHISPFAEDIVLDDNALSGGIPDSFSNFPELRFFSVINNRLSGTFPAAFFENSDSLVSVYAQNNMLTGPLPMFGAPRLMDFYAHDNRFTGTIPAWTDLPAINQLALQNNFLEGSMPESVCALQSQNLKDLWADCVSEVECVCCTQCF
jgi:Leucine-rich repeat (LRR) protein